MSRQSISIGILFVLVILVNLPSWLADDAETPLSEKEEAWQPNYQASNMQSTLYNDDGVINHRVYAQKMEHYQLLGFTLFQQPQYTIYIENQSQPWHVSAVEGTLYGDDRIQLETDVEIRSQTEQGFVQTIRTNFLEINLLDKTMFSDQPVEFTGQGFVINSNGFKGNLVTLQYELSDNVETVYAPYYN